MATSSDRLKHLAVIPARGGSKRLRRKNIIGFLGKPILAYTIEAARKAKVFARIIVSTEDTEIARVAKRYGAEVDNRPRELASDSATMADVCVELLNRLAKNGERFDTLTLLLATAALRDANDIRETVRLVEPGKCDYAMAVSEYVQPVHQALRKDESGNLTMMFPELASRRADSVGRYLVGNGSTTTVNAERFRNDGKFFGTPMRGYEMPFERAVDIDERDDLELSLFYAKKLRRKKTKLGRKKSVKRKPKTKAKRRQ